MALQLSKSAELMTPDPVSVDPAATLRDAMTMMHRFNVRHLPVTMGKQLIGILSDRDIRLYLSERTGTINETAADESKLDTVIVEDLMTRGPVTINPDTPLLETIDLLLEEKIGAVPVVDSATNGDLVGIVSYLDLLAYLRDLVVSDG